MRTGSGVTARAKATWLITVPFWFAVIATVAAASAMGAAPSLDVLREIQLEADSSVMSARGAGRFRYFRVLPNTGEYELATDAAITVDLSADKYRIELRCDSDWMGYSRRIIVHDGSVVGASRFSKNILPIGGEGELFPVSRAANGAVTPQAADFPWDPSHLSRALGHLPTVLKNLGEVNVRCFESDAGDWVVRYRSGGTSPCEMTFAKKYEFRIAKKIDSRASGAVAKAVIAKWRKVAGVWYIVELRQESGSGRSREKWDLDIEWEPNAPVDDSRFALAALELPTAARIIDRTRVGDRVEESIHYVPESDRDMKQVTDGMLKELAALPATRTVTGSPATDGLDDGSARSSRWFFAANAIIALLMALWLGMRWRRGRPMS